MFTNTYLHRPLLVHLQVVFVHHKSLLVHLQFIGWTLKLQIQRYQCFHLYCYCCCGYGPITTKFPPNDATTMNSTLLPVINHEPWTSIRPTKEPTNPPTNQSTYNAAMVSKHIPVINHELWILIRPTNQWTNQFTNKPIVMPIMLLSAMDCTLLPAIKNEPLTSIRPTNPPNAQQSTNQPTTN